MTKPANAAVELSVVVPTWQRRGLVTQTVSRLLEQRCSEPFEIVVVDDGCTDGTRAALEAIATTDSRLLVLSQPNRGRAAACNAGVAAARGRIVVLLDDDMQAAPGLLEAHLGGHRDGAEVVLGAIEHDPGSADTLLADAVEAWTHERSARLARSSTGFELHDVVTGHCSIRRDLFVELGGFDESFNRDGAFGDEDLELGRRLLERGCRIVYCAAAVARQRYVVRAERFLQQYAQAGAADVRFARKHPDLEETIFAYYTGVSRVHRLLRAPVLRCPALAAVVAGMLRGPVCRRVDRGARDALTARLLFTLQAIAYWKGVAYARRRDAARA